MTPDPLAAILATRSLLIFDLDGTLVDSSPLHARAFNAAFAELGVRVHYPSIAGLTTEFAVDRIAAEHGLSLDENRRKGLARDKRANVQRLIANELVAIDGAVEFVERAGPRFALALCTSGSRGTVAATLNRIGLADRFDPLVTAGDVPSKPDPAGFLSVLARRGATAEEALIFEDSDSGLAAAAAAGVDAICIAKDGTGTGVSGPALARCSWAPLLRALAEFGL